MKLHVGASAILALMLVQPVIAGEEFSSDHDADVSPAARAAADDHVGISSGEAMQMGEENWQSYARVGEMAMRGNNAEGAITAFRKALDLQPDDADLHLKYAEALEKKLKKDDERDPNLFNKCVREYLLVMRNEVGDEKGLGFKGMTLPGLGQFYRDEDHNIVAAQHIQKLVGRTPHAWETNAAFLKKVLKPTEVQVAGKVIKDKDFGKELGSNHPEEYEDGKIHANQKQLLNREQDVNMDR